MLMVIKIPGFTLTKRVKPQMLLVSGTQIQGGLPQLWRGGFKNFSSTFNYVFQTYSSDVLPH